MWNHGGYLKSVHNRELRSYPQVSKHILGKCTYMHIYTYAYTYAYIRAFMYLQGAWRHAFLAQRLIASNDSHVRTVKLEVQFEEDLNSTSKMVSSTRWRGVRQLVGGVFIIMNPIQWLQSYLHVDLPFISFQKKKRPCAFLARKTSPFWEFRPPTPKGLTWKWIWGDFIDTLPLAL